MQRLHHPNSGERNPSEMPLKRERLAGEGASHGPAPGMAAADAVAAAAAAAAVPVADKVPDAVQMSVRYTLFEYIAFTWQHCGYLIRRRRIGALASRWLCAKSTASAALHFILQGRSRRTYDFTIDAHGIVRASPTGVTLVPWRDVSAIRRYAGGYMVVLARGTLPIPFRCLDRLQMVAMDGFAALVRAAARQ